MALDGDAERVFALQMERSPGDRRCFRGKFHNACGANPRLPAEHLARIADKFEVGVLQFAVGTLDLQVCHALFVGRNLPRKRRVGLGTELGRPHADLDVSR